jgi:hypothetical protein
LLYYIKEETKAKIKRKRALFFSKMLIVIVIVIVIKEKEGISLSSYIKNDYYVVSQTKTCCKRVESSIKLQIWVTLIFYIIATLADKPLFSKKVLFHK